jgi:hypothetical protein
MGEKKRIEIRLDREKDADVIQYIENHVDNMAGFFKNLVRDYVRNKSSFQYKESSISMMETPTFKKTKEDANTNKNKDVKDRKRLPHLSLNVMSSKDISDNYENK